MVQLKLEDDTPPVGPLIGLYCDYSAIRLCYQLNNRLRFRFKRSTHDYYTKDAQLTHSFISFEFSDEQRQLQWQLVENRSIEQELEGSYGMFPVRAQTRWINSNENFDFFLWADLEEGYELLRDELLQSLQKLPFIKAARELDSKLQQKFTKRII